MPTLADLRAKLPELQGLDDDHAVDLIQRVYYPQADKALIAQRLGYVPPAPPKPERSVPRAAADVALSGMRGAVTGVRMFSDLAGADNAVSGGLRTADDALRGLQSPRAHADEQETGQIMRDAEGGSFLDQVGAAGRAFMVAPVSMAANALGTSLPTLAAAALPGGQAVLGARMAGGAIGAAQGVGAVKGSIYETVKAELLAAGAAPQEAEARAAQQQEYANLSAGQLGGAAALGAVAGSSGAERIVASMRSGAAVKPAGVLQRALMGGMTEAVPEAAQGAQEQYASNVALDAQGFDRAHGAGVIGAGALEGLASVPMGAGFGAMHRGPLTRAITENPVAPIEAIDETPTEAPPEQAEPGKKATRKQETATQAQALARMSPEGRAEALMALALQDNPKASPAVRRQAMNRLDVLMYGQEAISERAKEEAEAAAAPVEAPAAAPPDTPPGDPVAQREADRPAEPLGEPQPGDIMTGQGTPFKRMEGAARALTRAGPGHELVPVLGGLVVRKTGDTDANAQPSTAGVADGADAGGSVEPVGGDGDLAQLPDAPAGGDALQDAAEAVGRGQAPEPVGASDPADEALTPAAAPEPAPITPAPKPLPKIEPAPSPRERREQKLAVANESEAPETSTAPAAVEEAAPSLEQGEELSPRERRETRAAESEQAAAVAAAAPAPPADELVEHVTAKGKTIKGVWRAGLTADEAIAIDSGTFKRDGKHFIRERSLAKLAAHDAKSAPSTINGGPPNSPPSGPPITPPVAPGDVVRVTTGPLKGTVRTVIRAATDGAPGWVVSDTETGEKTVVGVEFVRKGAQAEPTPAPTNEPNNPPRADPAPEAPASEARAPEEGASAPADAVPAAGPVAAAEPDVAPRTPRDIGREAAQRGDSNEPPRALSNADQRLWRAGWSEAGPVAGDAADVAPATATAKNAEQRHADARRIGLEAGQRGESRDPPIAFTSVEKRLWRAGWDQSKQTAVTPQVAPSGKPSGNAPSPSLTPPSTSLSGKDAPAALDVLTMPDAAIEALSGKTVTIPVMLGDQRADMTMDAAVAVRQMRARVAAADQLSRCMR